MRLHKEAFPTVFFASVLFIFFNVGMWRLFVDHIIYHQILLGVSTAILFLIFFFFRVKSNIKPVNDNQIISPAYGTVVNIEEIQENEYFNDKRLMISIFMSPLNIHCNYVPFSGKIIFFKHFPGKYLVAFHPKSSELNEHTSTVIEGEKMTILVKQIAGFVARRIVPYLQEGQEVKQNDELGFIKFGSRVDVFFPLGTKLKVNIGDKLKGAQSVLANLPN